MPPSKDRSAAEVEERWVDFQLGLSDKRRYPLQLFKAFWEAGRRYAELTKNDPLIHRKVVSAVNGLTDYLRAERKRVPDQVLWDAQRLECLLFSGYDPHFEGDEPPNSSGPSGTAGWSGSFPKLHFHGMPPRLQANGFQRVRAG